MSERVIFLVDGFNVYHSIVACLKCNEISQGKWFNYRAYFEWLLTTHPVFSRDSRIVCVRLYSAFASHLGKPGVVERHKAYNAALEVCGVDVTLGNFKRKTLRCGAACGGIFYKYEEKETDVNVAMGVMEAFVNNEADCAVIVSGDTDLMAGIRSTKSLFPQKRVGVLMPAHRDNNHIRSVSDFAHVIKPKNYAAHQMPDQVVANDGTVIQKPANW